MEFDAVEDGIFGEEPFQHVVVRQQFRKGEKATQIKTHLSGTRFKQTSSGTETDSALGEIMQLENKSSAYMNQGKYFEAYGLLKRQYKLGPKIHFAPVLVKYIVALMQTERSDKVEKIRDELAELLKDKFAESADEIYKYAEYLLEENKLWEAVLFYQISLLYCEKPSSNYDPVYLLQLSVDGLTKCVTKILLTKFTSKALLKQHVISWIKRAKDLAIKATANNVKFSSLVQANLLHHQARCFMFLQELNVAKKLFEEAIGIIQHYHQADVESFNCYAMYLHNLGVICYRTNRLDEAEKYLNKSTEAAKKAKDFSTYNKNTAIQTNEKLLKKIKERQK